MGPNRASSRSTTAASTLTSGGARYSTRVMTSHATATMIAPTGKAMIIHCPKAIAGPPGNRISKIRTKDRFGGVPTSVVMPPTEQP